MDILLQSDGQLYPPRPAPPKPKPEPKPEPEQKPAPPPPPPAEPRALPWEDFLIMAIAFVVIKSSDQPDIPLLLALAYVLFDNGFSLKNLL
ncbi:MAG: hypothetical protein IJ043_00605 [Clostridia bacterium]|nr:hypothetical protein [Clostridia bacterium]